MDFWEKLKLHHMQMTVQDIEAWIKIAEGKGVIDKIARWDFSVHFKTNKDYANFLRLLRKQELEKIKLFKKHMAEQDSFEKKYGDNVINKFKKIIE